MLRLMQVGSVALLLLAFAAVATPAGAATVSVAQTEVSSYREGTDTLRFLSVSGAPGEANHLVVATLGAPLTSQVIEVRDTVPLTAGDGCSAFSEGVVRCDPGPAGVFVSVTVNAGDGDDKVDGRLVRQTYRATGGDGADRLLGPQGTEISGGAGDDSLTLEGGADIYGNLRDRPGELDGGAGADRLQGSSGKDSFLPDGPGADVGDDTIDGSGGFSTGSATGTGPSA